MPQTPFQRIVTGVNDAGKSIVAESGPIALRTLDPIGEGLHDTSWGADIWTVAHDPQRVFTGHTPEPWEVEPPPAGAVFRVVSFAPHSTIDIHTTATLDIGVIMSGEVWLTLEDGEVHLQPHDSVVVTGVPHGWENRSDEPCLIAAILMSTQPPDTW